MPIPVTCAHCQARFQVSDKFAGQSGPCPKCKKPIKVPEKSEEVVIHAPEEFGPKGTAGTGVLKPLEREEAPVSPVLIVAVVAGILACLAIAFFIGRMYQGSADGVPMALLALGAVVLAPPIAAGTYGLLRDAELQPYRGAPLWLRATLCGLVYALLWGVCWYVKSSVLGLDTLEMQHLVFLAPGLIAAGAIAPLASLDLDYTSGAIHYGIYLAATCALRLLMGLSLF